MSERMQKFIIILLIVNIILLIYFEVNINGKIENINSKLSYLNNNIEHVDNRVTNSLKNILNENKNMVENISYSYGEIDDYNNKVYLDLLLNLKAVNSNAKIYLVYNVVNDTDIKEVEFTKIKGLTYKTNLNLSLNKNYEYDIVERTENGGESILNINKQRLEIYNDFYSERVNNSSRGQSTSSSGKGIEMSFSVKDFGNDNYGIDKTMLEVRYKNKIIKNIDITDKLISGKEHHLIDRYHDSIASGKIDSDVSFDEFVKEVKKGIANKQYESNSDNMKSINNQKKYYYCAYHLKYDDYPELDLNMHKAKDLQFNLVILFKDGYIYKDRRYAPKKND